jgi:LysM repeat protein
MHRRSPAAARRLLRGALVALVALGLALAVSPARAAPKGGAVPETHRVYERQHLGMIAKRYNVSVEALRRANDLEPGDPIKPGQLLYIPPRDDPDGSRTAAYAQRQAAKAKAGGTDGDDPRAGRGGGKGKDGKGKGKRADEPDWKRWSKPPGQKGYVEIVSHETTWRGHVVGKNGKVLGPARKAFERLLGTSDGKTTEIDPRLIKLIATVSDTFGGRPIQVVSGYRLESYAWQSRHKTGHAMDFAIAGVPNAALREFAKTLPKVGVGYYPNSHFVHLDVREQWTYWVDYSGPGEPPRYAGFWTRPPANR